MHQEQGFIYRWHHFLARHLFYPLVLSSWLACGLWVGRLVISHSTAFKFMPWNLFLGWLPYLFSLLVVGLYARYPRRPWLLVLPFILWLIFFPNAPYMVTDILHLDEHPGAPVWYDTGLLITFAWTGLFLAVVSLQNMQSTVRSLLGAAAGWLLVAGTVVLSGLGIYLGRFLYWNSWDLLIQPQEVLSDIAVRVVHPLRHLQIYGVTIMFAALLLVCYVTYISIQQRERR